MSYSTNVREKWERVIYQIIEYIHIKLRKKNFLES